MASEKKNPPVYNSYMDYPVPQGNFEELIYSTSQSVFQLWSPCAEKVVLTIYNTGTGNMVYLSTEMDYFENGVWKATIQEDLKGKFYTFNVFHQGRWLGETPGITVKAVSVNGGKGAIIDMQETNPEGWENDKKPALKSPADIILYELHYRDFSISPTSGIRDRGKFLALTERGTRNPSGLSTGIDHLKELGITHVHVMPSFQFATIDETTLYENNYNWGYDPQNYNVPEGSYSTNPYNPITRILEFKEMVQALHKAGIRVIMDMVYNHTYNTEDSPFEQTVPGYFYRHTPEGEFANASGCGNETASERPMMRKYIIESLIYWIREYHVDGFRFDLMGIHDIKTMNQIRKTLHDTDPSLYIYGEGWAALSPQLPGEELAIKQNAKYMPGIGVFSDELRDSLRGPFNDSGQGGFLAGISGNEEDIKFGITGSVQHPQVNLNRSKYADMFWADEPIQMICYASCHDDMCLVDRIRATMPYIGEEELIRLHKLACTIILTAQGIPFLYGGEEILRDKKGEHNTHKHPDEINAIDWNFKTRYIDLFNYYKNLIALRKAHPAFRMESGEMVRKHLTFIDIPVKNMVVFSLNDHANGDSAKKIVVALNSNTCPVEIQVEPGNYQILCQNGKINLNGIANTQEETISVSPQSALIICK